MNKAELIANMAEKAGLSKKDAEAALNAFVASVEGALKKDDKVQLVGFGSFEVRKRAARKGRNPQTKDIQIYFIDNDDFFHRRKGLVDNHGVEFKDNDERCIFFARGVLETVKKLRWTPDVIYCSGWMSALVPLYVKKAYADTPFFENTKLILSLDNEEYKQPFGSKFADKLMLDGMLQGDVRSISGLPVGYEDLMRLAIDHSDAIVLDSPEVNNRLCNYLHNTGKLVLPYSEEDNKAELMAFCNSLCEKE